jgi:hypothetical protein
MDAAAGFAAQGEAIVFLGCFADFRDPRQRGKVIYPLEQVLLLCLLAVLAGAETFVDIARFGQKKIALLRRFLPFRDGRPRTTTPATFSQRSMLRNSSVASSPGSPS